MTLLRPKKNFFLASHPESSPISWFMAHLQCGEMNHAVDIWVSLEDLVKRSGLSDIDIVKFGPLAADELDAADSFLR